MCVAAKYVRVPVYMYNGENGLKWDGRVVNSEGRVRRITAS